MFYVLGQNNQVNVILRKNTLHSTNIETLHSMHCNGTNLFIPVLIEDNNLILVLLLVLHLRSRRPEVFCRKGVLRNFTKLTGKHLYQSIFFKKETLAQVFFSEFCEFFTNKHLFLQNTSGGCFSNLYRLGFFSTH